MLVAIRIAYELRTPAGSRDVVERALSRHASRCPTAMSLRGAVTVAWSATVVEGDSTWTAEGDRDT